MDVGLLSTFPPIRTLGRAGLRRARRTAAVDMSKHAVQRPRRLGEVERLDKQARVLDLSPAARAEEAPELLLTGLSTLRGLVLEGAERPELALSLDDLLHPPGAEGPDQLVLQVLDADEEAESFHVAAREAGAQTGPLETALEVAFLGGVAHTGQPDVTTSRAEELQEAPDRLGAADRHDRDALGLELPAPAFGQRFECCLIAEPFDKHDRHDRAMLATRVRPDSSAGRRGLPPTATIPGGDVRTRDHGMRLGVFVLFLAIALALAGPPALAQVAPTPDGPKKAKEDKEDKESKGNRGRGEGGSGGGESGPGDDDDDPGEGEDEGGPGDDEGDEDEGEGEGDPGDDEEDPGEDEGDPGDDDGDTGGGTGGGEPGGDGESPAGPEPSTDGSSSGGEDGRSSVATDPGCLEGCDSPGDTDAGVGGGILVTADGPGASDARLTSADAGGAQLLEFQDNGDAFGPGTVADASPAVLVLFAFLALGLLVGVFGGLRALHGRLSGD
jgi:hypothetical protein